MSSTRRYATNATELGEAWGGKPLGNFAARAVTGLAAGSAVAVLRGGRVSVQQIATDAFGNAIGQGLIDQSRPELQGIGPYSDLNYRNQMDIESDAAQSADPNGNGGNKSDLLGRIADFASTPGGSVLTPTAIRRSLLLSWTRRPSFGHSRRTPWKDHGLFAISRSGLSVGGCHKRHTTDRSRFRL